MGFPNPAFPFLDLSKARQRIWASYTYPVVYTGPQLLGRGIEAVAWLEFPCFSNLTASQQSLMAQLPSDVGICQPGFYSWLFLDCHSSLWFHSHCKA